MMYHPRWNVIQLIATVVHMRRACYYHSQPTIILEEVVTYTDFEVQRKFLQTKGEDYLKIKNIRRIKSSRMKCTRFFSAN
jgi:hypothetical protein